jgi:PAS domain S-box-containing protein
MRPKPLSFSHLSIRHRLPLLIGTLLLGIITASTWASYRGVKEAALEAGNERLQNLTQQLASLSQQLSGLLLQKTFTAANDPAIHAFLGSPNPVTRSAASASLQQFAPGQDANSLQVELWDANHSLILTVPDNALAQAADLADEFSQCAKSPFRAAGALRILNGVVVYPALAAAKDDAGKPLGYLVRWRRVSASSEPQKLKDLLGSEATLYFGNSRGDVWTDLLQPVSKPPLDLTSIPRVTYYMRDGNSLMAFGRPITGTPFFVVVEFPELALLAEARKFLRRMILIDAVLLTIGIMTGVALSRSITRPLHALNKAASAISGGDYSKEIDIQQNDELGSLAAGFNAMTNKVRASQNELQGKIQALEESEQRLHTVIQNLTEGLVVSDMEGQLLVWNQAALDLHGFANLDEALLKLPQFGDIFELAHLDGSVLEIGEWPLARVIRGERLHNLEVRIRRLGSDWNRIFSYGGTLVREANGTFAAVVTMTDITDGKLAQERASQLASIVESSSDAIIGKNLDGVITSWNQSAQELYGYSAEEVLERPISFLAPPEFSDEIGTILERLRRGESIDHFETERMTKDGKRLRVSLTISPIKEKSGAITGWSTSARDITQRKQAEEALQSSEIRYRRLFESALDGILILSGDSGKIVDVNPYLIQMLAYPKEELLGKQLWEIGTLKDIAASKASFLELQARDYVRYDDLPLESSKGKVFHVEVVANGYIEDEHRVVQCNIRDITERQMAQEDLRQTNQRLESAVAELHAKTHELATMTQQLWQASKLATMGELAASVAHELNNPLATISLHTELLADSLAPDDPDRQPLLVIDQEVGRMATLVSNLLAFSRRSHQQLSTLDICDELTSTLDFIQYHLRGNNIDIAKDYASGLPTVQGDREQLRQVFVNLITNASDAMPRGGTLKVRGRTGAMPAGGQAVVIEFSDTGTGIQTGDLPRLWEPFFTTKPEGKGTGLGLAICRRTVEEHRGTIEIETGPGKGTTVRITLPATAVEREVVA